MKKKLFSLLLIIFIMISNTICVYANDSTIQFDSPNTAEMETVLNFSIDEYVEFSFPTVVDGSALADTDQVTFDINGKYALKPDTVLSVNLWEDQNIPPDIPQDATFTRILEQMIEVGGQQVVWDYRPITVNAISKSKTSLI